MVTKQSGANALSGLPDSDGGKLLALAAIAALGWFGWSWWKRNKGRGR